LFRISKYWGIVLIVFAGGFGNTSQATGINFKAGFGYDFISQQYFLDSASQAGADSTLNNWALTNNYLDDPKGLFSMTIAPYTDHRWEMTSKYEQTDNFIRAKLLNELHTKIGTSNFDFNGELEWRHRYRDTVTFGDSYLYGYSQSRLAVPLSQSLKSTFQFQGEFVNFDSVSTFNFNYYRLGGKIGLQKLFENFSSGDIKLTFMSRTVPDSSQLSYESYGLESSYFGFYQQGELDFYGSLEKKNYHQELNRDDYFRMIFDGNNRLRLGQRLFIRQEINFEMTNYNANDPINRNYIQTDFVFLTGMGNQLYSFGLGPDLALLKEDEDSLLDGDDYFESGLKAEFDYMKINLLFASLESVTGYRNQKYDNEIQTDYTFERLNLIGNLRLFKILDLNLFFSAEWEWHEIATNNSQIYLLSSSLTYNF